MKCPCYPQVGLVVCDFYTVMNCYSEGLILKIAPK